MASAITKYAKEHGKTIVDAKKPLLLEVSSNDVRNGRKNEPGACAFARCAKRMLKADAAYFFRGTAYVERDSTLTRYTLPPSMQKEIVAFDRNKTMEPGMYQLSKPAKSETLAAALARSKKRPGRHQPGNTKIKRKFVHRTTLVRTKTLRQILAGK